MLQIYKFMKTKTIKKAKTNSKTSKKKEVKEIEFTVLMPKNG